MEKDTISSEALSERQESEYSPSVSLSNFPENIKKALKTLYNYPTTTEVEKQLIRSVANTFTPTSASRRKVGKYYREDFDKSISAIYEIFMKKFRKNPQYKDYTDEEIQNLWETDAAAKELRAKKAFVAAAKKLRAKKDYKTASVVAAKKLRAKKASVTAAGEIFTNDKTHLNAAGEAARKKLLAETAAIKAAKRDIA